MGGWLAYGKSPVLLFDRSGLKYQLNCSLAVLLLWEILKKPGLDYLRKKQAALGGLGVLRFYSYTGGLRGE